MKSLDPLMVDSYNYHLPSHLIAKEPANPPDSAKLLVYDRQKDSITHAIFKDLASFLPKNCNIFFNDTKVIKAKIFGKKDSGGKVELLLNRPLDNQNFLVFIKGRVKTCSLLYFDENLSAKVVQLNSDGTRVVKFYQNGEKVDFYKLLTILDKIGYMPLPPYINKKITKADEIYYQPLFAKKEGAVAAPTASLHFTPNLLKKLQEKFKINYITLHVGAGTFKPVEAKNILEHKMHSEYFEIPKDSIKIIESNKKILAVGTTVTRTIEYYARSKKSFGECDLFLHPLNPPIRVDYLLTNFHLPKSTLIMLVASFIGIKKTLELYKIAVEKRYRFYSYGDAMLIL